MPRENGPKRGSAGPGRQKVKWPTRWWRRLLGGGKSMGFEKEAEPPNLDEAKILPLREEDIEKVLAIERLSFCHPWSPYAFKQELRNSFSHLYCIKVLEAGEEKLVAYLCLWIVKDEGHVTNIAVHPTYRRQGLALRLLDFAEG